MERKLIGEKEFIFERIKVDDVIITVLGAISTSNPDEVEFISKRPKQMQIEGSENLVSCSVQEFTEEMRFLCNHLDTNGINDEIFVEAFMILCQKHITEKGKLIDIDLFSYIDKAIILQDSIYVGYGSELSENQSTQIWIELLKLSIQKFRNEIAITQYDLTDPLNPKSFW